jgi:hypothetical protein
MGALARHNGVSDPDFELEARYASPKILPLLEEAREPEAVR